MSMIDVLTRVDAICKKYDRYDADKHRNDGDPFSRLYAAVDAEIDAASVTLNADVRRSKARLLEEVVKLQKIAAKKVKGLSPEEKVLRADLVAALPHRIQAIPDDCHGGGATDQDAGWNARPGIKLDDYSAERLEEGYFYITESEQFRREYEMRRIKHAEFRWDVQDEGLDFISQGLETLKNLAEDMNEELDRQIPLMDEIDTKVDRASLEIRKTNVRLKQTINQFRSTRNFTVDIILICIILSIVTYSLRPQKSAIVGSKEGDKDHDK